MIGWMLCTADTHGRLVEVWRESDFIVIAGDLCADGTVQEQRAWLDGPFRQWLVRQTVTVVAVAGNHDHVFEQKQQPKDLPWTYLENQAAVVNGRKFFGSPHTLYCGGAFSKSSEDEVAHVWETIPADTDVLITHGEPFGIFDDSTMGTHRKKEGSFTLLRRIYDLQIPLHLFGHNHLQHGHVRLWNTLFVNCTSGSYKESHARHKPWGLADDSWRK